MNYFWTVCPKCSGEITVQYVENAGGVSGSLRRWSSDRSVNDGRKVETPKSEVGADGGFRTACLCGETIEVDPARVTRATTERPAV
jgi:hypothetical protein